MRSSLKYILFFYLFISLSSNISAQFYFLEDVHDQIELKFLKKKIETSTNETFFNALKIKNPTNKPVEFQTNFSFPANWSFMGDKKQRIKLEPYDSIFIPFRAAAAFNAKGDIGYAIVASLSDLKGITIKNEYSFVNIPKIQNIQFKPINRIDFFDQSKKSTEIQFLLENNGNTDEIIYLDLNFDNTIETPGTSENLFRMELTIPPLTDTIVRLPINLIPDINYYNKKLHKIAIKAYTADTILHSTVWLKELEKSYRNSIPDNYKLLSLEMGAQNLFSDYSPSYSINLNGNVLFKDESDIFYDMQGYGSNFWNDPWTYGRYRANYTKKGFRLKLGDISENFGQSMFGRGGAIKYTNKSTQVNAIATKPLFSDALNMGGTIEYSKYRGTIGIGFSYVKNNSRKVNSKLGFVNLSTSSKTLGSFRIGFESGIADWYISEPKRQIGYGGSFGYSNIFKTTRVSLFANYREPELYGGGGIFLATGSIYTPINKYSSIATNYYNSRFSPVRYIGDSVIPDYYNNYDELRSIYSNYINSKFSYFAGGISEGRGGNQFYSIKEDMDFATRNALLTAGLKIRSSNGNSINFSFKGGYSFATQYPHEEYDTLNINNNWLNFQLSSNFRSRLWGLTLSYYHGPYTINQQLVYFLNGYSSKSIRIMPYANLTLVPKYLQLISRLNFNYDVSANISRLNFTNELKSQISNTWEISFSSMFGYQSNIDKITKEKYKFSSSYFEIRVKKDLIFDQPRYQYHNLTVIFFKDLNGNRIKDIDEPGIKNIFLSIRNDEEKLLNEEYNTSGFFMTVDLLSDYSGVTTYENIPNGFYTLEYYPISKIEGAFTSEESVKNLHIGKDETLYIPFNENNKIFGNVVLNRSKLSNLGLIDISNIKITAEDSKGKKFSALTDDKGNFIIYVPDVDKYKLRAKNIFFENFELEQNDYEIQLNGYRQFEVNFIFNEKKRKINFASSYEYGSKLDGPGVEIIRRTNLSGTIKDATTLKPIVSTIRVIDDKGDEITSGRSSLQTGIFSLSFVAGDDYSVEVNADEYWFHAEKLYSQQIVTFKNLKKEILLRNITVGQLIPMKTLNFEAGSYDIPATSFPELERLMKVLKKNPSVKIDVHGHADDQEILESESDLALERAKLVAKYLIANGYNRVKYSGHANTKPIADNDTEDGRRLNRRVEIVVTGK